MPRDKERTVLMDDDAPKPKKGKEKVVDHSIRTKSGGIGGTIGNVERTGKPGIDVKWRAGLLKGTPGAGRRKRAGKLSSKARSGFRFEVKF